MRHLTIEGACKVLSFCLEKKEDTYSLKRDHDYFYQIQYQLYCCDMHWCDFVVRIEKDMDCLPIPQFCLDFLLWSIQKSAHLAQALQIGIFHSLASMSMWFTHTTRCKLCCYTVVYTSTRCLAQAVAHYLHCFERLVVHNIDSLNVGPPPSLSPT